MTKKHHVLVVDDDPAALRLTGYIFHRADFEVHVASNGVEALAKADEVKPDLVVLDVMMPDMSGLEVCQRLRSRSSTARLPIIMLSAKGQPQDKVDGFKVGADDYVAKPVDADELLARANALLHRASHSYAPRAYVIAVVGAKGGVGVTVVAVNLAAALTTKGYSVALAELRDHRGTAAPQLNLTPTNHLGSLLVMEPSRIGKLEVSRTMTRHASGIRVLAAPQDAAGYSLTAPYVEEVLNALSSEAEYLILDLPAAAGEAVRLACERADQILLITEPEYLSVACSRSDLETFREWGLFDLVSVVAVSRSRSSMLMNRSDVERELGVPLAGAIPPAPEAFHEVARLGAPLVISKPEVLAAQALMELAAWVVERSPAKAKQ